MEAVPPPGRPHPRRALGATPPRLGFHVAASGAAAHAPDRFHLVSGIAGFDDRPSLTSLVSPFCIVPGPHSAGF